MFGLRALGGTVIVLFACALPGCHTPPGADPASGRLIDFRQAELDNGLRVLTIEDRSCPIVNVQLWYHVGSKDERPDRQGFAHMFEHMMFRGTDRLGPTGHFDLIHGVGGSANAYTSADQTVYHQTVPARQLELALWLEAERMAMLKIDQPSFDTERKVVEEERRMGLNQPYGDVYEKMLAAVYQVHPYRWSTIGQIPHLRAASVAELRDFWNTYYVPNNAVLVIAGDIQHAQAQALARRMFGWIPRGPQAPRVTAREPEPAGPRQVTLASFNAPAPVARLVYPTVPTVHPDETALRMLAHVLGGGPSSRLYRALVVDRRIAVNVSASTDSREQAGAFHLAATLPPDQGDLDAVLAALADQVAAVRDGPVSERELLKARNQLLRELVTGSQRVARRAGMLGYAAAIEGDPERVNREAAAVRAVTTADLQRVARAYLAPERRIALRIVHDPALGKPNSGDEAPITAVPEKVPVPAGRPGVVRPADFPAAAPLATGLDGRFPLTSHRFTLDNGLQVLVVPNHETPFVTLELGLRAGAWCEDKPGAADIALELLTKGTARFTEQELAEELGTYAITLGGSAGMDASSVQATCLSEHTERAAGLLAEAVLRPTFPAGEFEQLVRRKLVGLRTNAARPATIADRFLRRELYGDHPYVRETSGEPEDVEKLTVDDAVRWWRNFARPDMAMLLLAGDITEAQARALARQTLGTWRPATPRTPAIDLPALPPARATRIVLVDQPGAVQSQIRIGQPGPIRQHPGYAAAVLASHYFGGSFSSRVNQSLRVEKGLTYGARGGFQAQRLAGSFRLSTFTGTGSTAQAVRALLEQAARLKSQPPSQEELAQSQAAFLGSFAADHETPQQVAAEIWRAAANDLPADFFEQLPARIARLDADQVMALVRGTVDESSLAIVVVGDAAKLQADLEKIAPVTVVKP